MAASISLSDITIRTYLQPGDIGYITYLHGLLYRQEYNLGIAFKAYVAAGLAEFYQQYTDDRNRVWVAEHNGKIVGFLLLMDRGDAAQLRYFIVTPGYRGLGLGKKLMDLYMAFLHECGYTTSYLWTTHELTKAASLYQSYGFQLSQEKESTDFGKALIEQRYDLAV
ncbi:GNAT family N-acetyltransferase [Nibribacter ruber]|uniref:GNAT family N-acetyltransferase n=1 Tax=Nibribacter ruber TaxID=2698458 RepID=A0A6P1P0E5_9BACT|nr:GNAT family N-acetyltransferase [Nibribacter ruber]QHL86422.1 GNAT family N-acetyltransferase [Nibribacter ruber]